MNTIIESHTSKPVVGVEFFGYYLKKRRNEFFFIIKVINHTKVKGAESVLASTKILFVRTSVCRVDLKSLIARHRDPDKSIEQDFLSGTTKCKH